MEKLLNLKQLAEHFGVSLNTAARLPIAYTKVGRQRRYHPTLIKRYEILRASKVNPRSYSSDTRNNHHLYPSSVDPAATSFATWSHPLDRVSPRCLATIGKLWA